MTEREEDETTADVRHHRVRAGVTARASTFSKRIVCCSLMHHLAAAGAVLGLFVGLTCLAWYLGGESASSHAHSQPGLWGREVNGLEFMRKSAEFSIFGTSKEKWGTEDDLKVCGENLCVKFTQTLEQCIGKDFYDNCVFWICFKR